MVVANVGVLCKKREPQKEEYIVFTYSLNHSKKQELNACYMSGPVPGLQIKQLNNKNPCPHRAYILL